MAKESKKKEIRSKVAGVTFEHRQPAIKAHGKRGRKLILVHEPDNPASDKAVAVYLERPRLLGKNQHYHIGYLNSRLADDVQKAWSKDQTVTAKITEITGGTKDKPTQGVNILVTIE